MTEPAGSVDDGTFAASRSLIESLQGGRAAKPPGVPPFSISTITASGIIDDRHVRMNVEFLVSVDDDRNWVKVPIELPSWQIQEFEEKLDTSGASAARSEFRANADDDRIWYLRGRGKHLLNLTLIGEVRSTEPGRRRLRMSLPKALISSLRLAFMEEIEPGIESNCGVGPEAIADQEMPTFEFWGLQQETEVVWQPAIPAGETATVVRAMQPAELQLDLRASLAELTCTQELRIEGGLIDQLQLQLPSGYGEVAISGRDGNGVLIVRPSDVSVSDDRSSAAIQFREPVRGDVTLELSLGMASMSYPQEIVVAVPDILSVDDESGVVNVLIPRGLDVVPQGGVLPRRATVESQADGRPATAFMLRSTKVELRLSVSEIDAHFGVEPQLEISTNGQALLMLARFPVNVSQGSLNELLVDWKDFAENGWQIQPGTTQLLNEAGTSPTLAPNLSGDQIRLELGDYQSGRFAVEFRAFRTLTADDQERLTFWLPDISDSTGHSTTVRLIESDKFALTLTGTDGQSQIPRQLPDQLSDPQLSNPQQPITSWLVPPATRVRVRQSPQKEEVSATAVIALQPAAAQNSIHVNAQFSINVRYRDLIELRMAVPPGIFPTVRLNGRPDPLPAGRSTGGETVWPLPKNKSRQLTVTVDYNWEPRSGAAEQNLPLVLPAQGLTSLTVGTDSPDIIRPQSDSGLQDEFSERFLAAWRTDEERTELPLQLALPMQAGQANPPSIAVVRTEVNGSAVTSTTTAIYAAAPREVRFSVPAGANVTSIAMNGSDVPLSGVKRTQVDAAEWWSIPVSGFPADGPASVSLTALALRSPHHHMLSADNIARPRVVQAPDWLPTVWIVSAPDDTCLVSQEQTPGSVLRPSVFRFFGLGDAERVPPALDTVISGFPASVQNRFRQIVRTSQVRGRPSLVYVSGPQLREIPILVFSRAAGWLATAGLAIVFYGLLFSLRRRLLVSLLVVSGLAVLIWFLTPLQYFDLLFPIVPALAMAVTVWVLRIALLNGRPLRRGVGRRRSVFSPSHATDSQGSVPTIVSGSRVEAAAGP